MAGFFKKRMLCPYRRATIAAEAMEKHAIILRLVEEKIMNGSAL
jgi:hypothetical protein